MTPLHIGIAGPIATPGVGHWLDGPTAHLPPGGEGAPLLATLIAELLRRGHRVSAFTLSPQMALRRDAPVVASGSNFTLHCCPVRPRAWPPNGRLPGRIVDLYAFERHGLRAAMLAASPDVIHAHWSYEYAWAALRTGLPHVITCHDSPVKVARFYRDFRHGAYRWLRAAIAWHVLRHARRVTAVSPYMAGQLAPWCRVPVAVVPNPIASWGGDASAAPRSAGAEVLIAGNGWNHWKNGVAGLQAYALLHRRLGHARLHLFGQGSEEGGPVWRAWRELGSPGQVVFHGAVAHEDLRAAMAAGDLLLHPSLEESFGAVLAEAMSTGLPVVAGRDSGAVSWVVGDAGALVDVRRPQAMADAMLRLLLDRGESARMGRRGRERVRTCFGPDVVAARYEREYEGALACAAAGRRGLA
jgi:glycosyltransferase involved in cell wall biosynthesis